MSAERELAQRLETLSPKQRRLHDVARQAMESAGFPESPAAHKHVAEAIKAGHIKNPRNERFLTAPTSDSTNAAPGVGIDGVYRDPWGSPYLVTLDLNGDGRARDVLYREAAVSACEPSQEPQAVIPASPTTSGLPSQVRAL